MMEIRINISQAFMLVLLSFFIGFSFTWGSNIADKYFDWKPAFMTYEESKLLGESKE